MPYLRRYRLPLLYGAPLAALCVSAVAAPGLFGIHGARATPGPRRAARGATALRPGDARRGQQVFRFETFGTDGFWTDAMRMPQGMMQAKVTPLMALRTGLNVDVDAVPADMRATMAAEAKTDLSPANAPMLNDPEATVKLVNANAVIGIVVKDTDGDGTLDIRRGDHLGITCALCHTITDRSGFGVPGKGAVGHRMDGRTPHSLNLGKLLALAANSRAFFTNLQLDMGGGKTIGRAPKGLTAHSTEAEVDAYLDNPKHFPLGAFDDTPDGIGNPIHITPLFRQDLAAPFGSSGQEPTLDDFSNAAYTVIFDPTTLLTPDGRKFLKIEAGKAGLKLAHDYALVLKATGVKGYPFVHAKKAGKPGDPDSPVGLRVDEQKLLDLRAYLVSLPAPRGLHANPAAEMRGRALFRAERCTRCHNEDQSKPVPTRLVPMKTIFPGYRPTVILKRPPPFSPVQNSPGTFDDKMVVVTKNGAGPRGAAFPLLLDLARKPVFLHDDSVPSLDALLNPARGSQAPHPFFLRRPNQRADMVAFLKGLDTRRKGVQRHSSLDR